jgi:branched-chain amino acid transport system permease protein
MSRLTAKVRFILKLMTGLACVVAAIALPGVTTSYETLQLSLMLSFVVAILGLDIVTGHAGLASLGQSAFFGLGAYTAAAMANAGWPAIAALAAAAVACTVAGLVIGVPATRLGGHSLAMVTLALPVLAVPLAKRLSGITGGSMGISAHPLQAPAWSGLPDDQFIFYVLLALACVMVLLARNLVRGRFGRALRMIRLNEIAATSVGVSVGRYKVAAFACASMFGGVAGFMYVSAIGFMSPEAMNLLVALNMLIALVVGGMRSLTGAVIGGVFYVVLPELANALGAAQSGVINIVTGAAVLLIVFLARGGIASLLERAAVCAFTAKTPDPH